MLRTRPDGNRIAGYGVLDLNAVVPLGQGWDLFGRLGNVTDRRYETAWGYNTPGANVFFATDTFAQQYARNADDEDLKCIRLMVLGAEAEIIGPAEAEAVLRAVNAAQGEFGLSLRQGAKDYIVKPVKADELIAKIKQFD